MNAAYASVFDTEVTDAINIALAVTALACVLAVAVPGMWCALAVRVARHEWRQRTAG